MKMKNDDCNCRASLKARHFGMAFMLLLAFSEVREARAEDAGEVETAPGPSSSLGRLLTRTASVVEGEVSDISFSYDDWAGPRTLVTFSGLTNHLGPYQEKQVTLSMAGGPLPDGRWAAVSELPRFRHAVRYIVFLRKGHWRVDPRVEQLAVVRMGKRDVLANEYGVALSRFSEQAGFQFGRWQLFEGRHEGVADFGPVASSHLSGMLRAEIEEQAPDKTRILDGLRAIAKTEGIGFGRFDPEPNQSTPWNEIPVAGEAP